MENPFGDIVKIVGFLTAAAFAIGISWRRRSKWEPDISDVPGGPAKVAGLLTSIALGMLWYDEGASLGLPSLQLIAFWGAVASVIGLLAYVLLNTVYVYEQEYADGSAVAKKRKIIGGFWLTKNAKNKHQTGEDIQTLLIQAANNVDRIWPRISRGLAQLFFIVGYIVLVCGGTIALTALAILLLKKI